MAQRAPHGAPERLPGALFSDINKIQTNNACLSVAKTDKIKKENVQKEIYRNVVALKSIVNENNYLHSYSFHILNVFLSIKHI